MGIAEVRETFHELPAGASDRFDALAQQVFAYQRRSSDVYGRYCSNEAFVPLRLDAGFSWEHVPFLPVEAFKHAPVTTFPPEEAVSVFESSGTGRSAPSRHYVRSLAVYEKAVSAHFERVFGTGPFTFLAHLPHYTERGSRSSLLYMVEYLIGRYGDGCSGLFLEDRSLLEHAVTANRETDRRLILFGAAFGLLDLLEEQPIQLPEDALVVETGGMKTYRRSVGRGELHERLASGFSIPEASIRSEYGMCELMSQCYTRGEHIFYPPPWVQFRVVDPEKPSRSLVEGEPGALALFDLANMHTVSALLTADRAVRRGGGFEVLGRLSDAELRGCNFLLERGR